MASVWEELKRRNVVKVAVAHVTEGTRCHDCARTHSYMNSSNRGEPRLLFAKA